MPILILVSAVVSMLIEKRLGMPSIFAYCRPVDGRICINPYAFAADLTSAVKVDSCAMSAAIRYGSSCRSAE